MDCAAARARSQVTLHLGGRVCGGGWVEKGSGITREDATVVVFCYVLGHSMCRKNLMLILERRYKLRHA